MEQNKINIKQNDRQDDHDGIGNKQPLADRHIIHLQTLTFQHHTLFS